MNVPRRAASVFAPCALLLVWFGTAQTGWATRHAIPSPRDVIVLAWHEALGSALCLDVGATAARTFVGVGIAAALGSVLAFALARAPARWRAAEPTVEFLRSIPPILSYPVFLLALGYGETSRIAAVVFGSSGIVVLSVARAIVDAPAERRDTVKLAGLRGIEAMWALDVHEALPALFGAVRLSLTSGLIVVVVSEMLVGAQHGLGARAQTALLEYRADGLWLVILVAGTLHLGLSGLLMVAERRLLHWRRG